MKICEKCARQYETNVCPYHSETKGPLYYYNLKDNEIKPIEVNTESTRLYKYLIANFPLYCNSHNAIRRMKGKERNATVEDIAMFVFEQLKECISAEDLKSFKEFKK